MKLSARIRWSLTHGLRVSILGLVGTTLLVAADLPPEPLVIGSEPQFLFDNFVVDNHWALRSKRESVQRIFHTATKHPANPLLSGDDPSHLWVVRDDSGGVYRMYYQANFRVQQPLADTNQESLPAKVKGRKFKTYIAYAESRDGVRWSRPQLELFGWHRKTPNNIVIGRTDLPEYETCSPCLLEVPVAERRRHRWLMLYRAKGRHGHDLNGIRLAGSADGIHWNTATDTRIAHLHSDHHNTISYDPRRNEFVMFCRAKHIYRRWGETMIDTGASRRVARLANQNLWTDWLAERKPQTVLVPDETDNATRFNYFYGMPSRYFAGVYWGFLEPFRLNDFIYTELVLSRDGFQFQRLPGRPKLIEYGLRGAWDDEMILASPSWVEVGDEWWIYYNGWDGPHGTAERHGGIGLAKVRKEGFVSLRGPAGGGVVCTRLLRWPGGGLLVNADASRGELRVRLSDAARTPLAGFDYADCHTFRGNGVAHEVTWKSQSIRQLSGRSIRLEFFLKDADLFTFTAQGTPDRE